jgi:hypothetical protein
MTTIIVMDCITTIMAMIVASFVAIDERGPLALGDDFSAASARAVRPMRPSALAFDRRGWTR